MYMCVCMQECRYVGMTICMSLTWDKRSPLQNLSSLYESSFVKVAISTGIQRSCKVFVKVTFTKS